MSERKHYDCDGPGCSAQTSGPLYDSKWISLTREVGNLTTSRAHFCSPKCELGYYTKLAQQQPADA